ncbi:MAG: ParA family protein [Pseudomonadota bacterium]
MDDGENGAGFPTINDAWDLILGHVPEQYQQSFALFAVLAVLIYAAVKFITALLGLVQQIKTVTGWGLPKEPEIGVPDDIRAPRIGFWNEAVRPGAKVDWSTPRVPVVTTAAMKGGVGKTTITANLAAYFDNQGKRVLMIDFDYQGSLSQMALAAANKSKKGTSVDDLISGDRSMIGILDDAESLKPALQRSKILTCYYEFSNTETEEMIAWIVDTKQGQNPRDIRFRLETLLSDPAIKNDFDLVLIDSPPRFTTGSINAFCASTHLLIPTVLDQMSAEAAVYFSQDIAAMRQNLFPNLELIGVVPSMTWRTNTFSFRENNVIDYLESNLGRYWGGESTVLKHCAIPRKNAFGNVAGSGISYLNAGNQAATAEVRAIVDRLGKHVADTIWNEN